MGKYFHGVAEKRSFDLLSPEAKRDASVVIQTGEGARFQYFFGHASYHPGTRLNVVGHGDRGDATFVADLPGASTLTADELATAISPLVKAHQVASIRLVACRSGATGLARTLALRTGLPVKAPIGTVSTYEIVPGRHWVLKKTWVNPRRPEDHIWGWHLPSVAAV